MKKIHIIKSTGEKALFDPEKIKATCVRAGASPELAEHIAKDISLRVREGTTTKEILDIVLELLAKEKPEAAAKFSLRDALLALGPSGFNFEIYVAELLKAYGYKTELPELLQGACIKHEVDVVAERYGRKAMIECKLRLAITNLITIKDVMSTWARFLDLVDGSAVGKCPHLDEVWIVTNSRLSLDGVRYGHCKNMVMLSWNHPRERPLPAWIDDKALYPVTILRTLQRASYQRFADAGIMLVQDILAISQTELAVKTGLDEQGISKLVQEASQILGARPERSA